MTDAVSIQSFMNVLSDNSRPLVDQVWELIRAHKLTDAKMLLAQDAPLPDTAEQANFWMLVGIITCLEADYCEAEDHFGTALDYYDATGKVEQAMTIRLYLAYLYRSSGADDLAAHYLKTALAWFDANHKSVVVHWWHPPIMNETLGEAIRIDCFPRRARIMREQSRFHHARTHRRGKVSTHILLSLP